MNRQGLVAAWVIGVGLGLSGWVGAEPVRWEGNGHWYEAVLVQAGGISWDEAQKEAEARGGYLATITSAAENQFVYELIDNGAYWHWSNSNSAVGPWIGAVQPPGSAEPRGNWQWVTGESFIYDNWRSDQPNNTNGVENHAHFVGVGSARSAYWNDLGNVPPSDWYVKAYVVESVPEPGALGLLAVGAMGMMRRKRG